MYIEIMSSAIKQQGSKFIVQLSKLQKNVLFEIWLFFSFRFSARIEFHLISTLFFVIAGLTTSLQSYTNDTSSAAQLSSRHASSTENFDDYNNNDKDLVNNALNRGPYFDISASKNVTALVGKTAYLNCRIRNLGNKTVSTFYLPKTIR